MLLVLEIVFWNEIDENLIHTDISPPRDYKHVRLQIMKRIVVQLLSHLFAFMKPKLELLFVYIHAVFEDTDLKSRSCSGLMQPDLG